MMISDLCVVSFFQCGISGLSPLGALLELVCGALIR
jgi:hypothetical protein